jgi:predicted nucleic acid-binding protein
MAGNSRDPRVDAYVEALPAWHQVICRQVRTTITAITVAELRYGADRKGSRKLHTLIDTFVAAVEIAPFDQNAAREFGRISMLAARGTSIGEFDLLIAASRTRRAQSPAA